MSLEAWRIPLVQIYGRSMRRIDCEADKPVSEPVRATETDREVSEDLGVFLVG